MVKNNQKNIRSDIEYYFQNEEVSSFETIEKNGGRIEKRTAYATSSIDWLTGKERFN